MGRIFSCHVTRQIFAPPGPPAVRPFVNHTVDSPATVTKHLNTQTREFQQFPFLTVRHQRFTLSIRGRYHPAPPVNKSLNESKLVITVCSRQLKQTKALHESSIDHLAGRQSPSQTQDPPSRSGRRQWGDRTLVKHPSD